MITTTQLAAMHKVVDAAQEYKTAYRRVGVKEAIEADGLTTLFNAADEAHRKLFAALDELEKVSEMTKKERVEAVVQELDKQLQAKGVAIGVLNGIKLARRTPEENKEQAEKDAEFLFGPKR